MLSWFTQTWFTQGILHPFFTPAHIILILGLASLLGQQNHLNKQPDRFIEIIVITTVSVLIGLALNQFTLIDLNSELILLSLALIAGLLITLRLKLPTFVNFTILFLSGLMLGFDSSPIMIPGLGENSIYSWKLGAALTLILSINILAILASFLDRFWNGIILRIIGSWIATSAIFVLTLILAGQ